jgi:hypothetical protein
MGAIMPMVRRLERGNWPMCKTSLAQEGLQDPPGRAWVLNAGVVLDGSKVAPVDPWGPRMAIARGFREGLAIYSLNQAPDASSSQRPRTTVDVWRQLNGG